MRMLIMAVLFVASLATPSAALDMQAVADFISTMVLYDLICGGLPARTQQLAQMLARDWEDRDMAETAKRNVLLQMGRKGKEAWCAEARPMITAIEEGRLGR